MTKVGINGFGRIGRFVFRAAQTRNDIEMTLAEFDKLEYLVNAIFEIAESGDIVITMGGVDITNEVYAEETITIPSVTGAVVITATATTN